MSLARRARELVEAARTRGDVKRLAAALDADPALRRAVWEEGVRRGVELPEEALAWPAVRLLRRARGREALARVRSNPVRRSESFTCAHCGREVLPATRTDRDHCPACLRSLHVDRVPGDRARDCGGVLDPVGGELVAGHPVIHYRCRACGETHRVRALLDGVDPDDWQAVVDALANEPRP